MGDNTPGKPPVRRRWLRRLVRGFLLLLLVLLLLAVGFDIVWRYVGARHLAAAVEEADRQDPKWRWDDIQASRAEVADEDNGALQIAKIAEHLPESWPDKGSPLQGLPKSPPPMRLASEEVRVLREELKPLGPALTEAHALARFRTGRFPVRGAVESFAAREDPLRKVRSAVSLLSSEAFLLAEDGKVSEAVVSARTAFHAGRAIGDEPGANAMLSRMVCRGQAVRGVERALSQGEASDAVLAETKRLVDEEETADLLTQALRGDRAQFFEVNGCLEAGDLERLAGGNKDLVEVGGTTAFARVEIWLKLPWFRENRAQALEWATRAVEYAGLPVEEQPAKFEQLKREVNRTHDGGINSVRWGHARMSAVMTLVMPTSSHRSHAELRCASAALAAERYRLAKGKWPDSLGALVPDYLPAVPKDPYTGEPIRLRRLDDGLAVYSVGPDKKDEGGTLQHLSQETYGHKNYGFRLWDVKHRRQAPTPDRPDADDDP
jgi:hypothetical protein